MVPITNCQWLYSQSKVFFLPFTVDQACKRTILRIMADALLVRSNLGMTMAQKNMSYRTLYFTCCTGQTKLAQRTINILRDTVFDKCNRTILDRNGK